MEGACSCYIAGHFNGGRMEWIIEISRLRMGMLWRWPVKERENGHVTEVV